MYSHVHPEDCAVLKQFVGQVKEGKATSLSKEVRINRGNGKYSWTSYAILSTLGTFILRNESVRGIIGQG